MSFVFEPESQVAVPVAGDNRSFPVRRVYCVGRNYAAHAREMGFDPARELPFFFCKPDNAIVPVPAGSTVEVPYPSQTSELIWSVPEIVANLSIYFELRPGDLIFTGTPEGVAGVQRGQTLHGGIDGLGELRVKVA